MSSTARSPSVRSRRLWLLCSLAVLGAGLYVGLLVTAPLLPSAPLATQHWNRPVPHTDLHEQRLYIPRLQLSLPYASGSASALDDGVWHRFPERGDPEKGGNFILAGHRFVIGLTPGETRRKSPFYFINTVKVGDYVYADWGGKRYQYEVTAHYEVKPSQISIEASSQEPKMTLYTCTLGGEADGRDVLEAKLVAKDVNPRTSLAIRR